MQKPGLGAWAGVISMLSVAGCGSSGPASHDPDACRPGERGCVCDRGGCDDGLACLDGLCAPLGCPRGEVACACASSGTCDGGDASALACLDNVCATMPEPTPGSLGGACDGETPCTTSPRGPLGCVRGVCELAACPSGTPDCPCGPLGSCAPAAGAPGRCLAGRCAVGDDVPAARRRAELVVSGAFARSCRAAVELGGGARLEAVRFGAGVRGGVARHGSRLGLVLVSEPGASLAGPVATIETAGLAPSLTLAEGSCADGGGGAVGDAVLRLQ